MQLNIHTLITSAYASYQRKLKQSDTTITYHVGKDLKKW